ncbi:MAG: alpha-E domain-containing protein [Leptospiraceae bacterium]|nr:alpha-E domain-containing protein [Leptospiraceae bacterium]
MLSRVANAVYWMNRYIERAENYARFMDVNFNLSLDLPPNIPEQWQPLVITTGDWALFESLYNKPDKNNVIHFLAFSEENPSSIYNCVLQARENARTIRPEITKEVWEQTNYLYFLVKEGRKKKFWQKQDPRSFFVEIKKGCQLLYGIFDATISRTEGYHFGNIGKLLERADKTSRILDVKYHILLPAPQEVGTPLDLIQWVALLKSASAYDMYQKKYGKLNVSSISEFLILDKEFPRAMLRCLLIAEKSLSMISRNANNSYLKTSTKKLGLLKSELEYSDISDIIKVGIHEYLDRFQQKLNHISEAIYSDFFSIQNIINKNKAL